MTRLTHGARRVRGKLGRVLMLVALNGCAGSADDTRAYPAALEQVARAPGRAVELCASVRRVELRDDCILAGVEALASEDPSGASALCARVEGEVSRDECAFQVAERSGDPKRCADAGRFVDDCRMHLWSRDLRGRLKPGARPGDVEAELQSRLADYGFQADDPRPWSALYRELLSRQRPLDRASCAEAPTDAQREACRQTGISVYDDRLNMARDRHLVRCGEALPGLLETTADPELDALRARRWSELCP